MPASSPLRVVELRVGDLVDPIGIDDPAPRLSWRLAGGGSGVSQAAFQVEVRDEDTGAVVWDTGRRPGRSSMQLRYDGAPLVSRARYVWRARAWAANGTVSSWSDDARWEMGLMKPRDWRARWIRRPEAETVPDVEGVHEVDLTAPLLRTELTLAAAPARARVFATALGLYELRVNGTKVGDQVLTPGWTDYHRRIQYQTFDVTSLLRAGSNAIAALLGHGWYCGHVAFFGRRVYGDFPALLVQLEVLTADGKLVTVASDPSWRTAPGGLCADDLLMGEHEDARAWPYGWDRAGFDDSGWEPARLLAPPGGRLVAQVDPGTAVIDVRAPVATTWRGDRCIVDVGQNIVGHLRLELEAPASTEVTVRHGEALDDAGGLYTANLRSAEQTDVFVTSGGSEIFEPRFTFHGFRYAEVSGLPAEAALRAVSARVVSANLEPTGEFSCSDPMLKKLQENIVWSQRGNFLSVPTDCPQRDERLGWTGDAQIFAPTAAWNMNVLPFFRKWLADLEDAQDPSGAYTDVAPTGPWRSAGNSGWSDAGILIPWYLYVRYGAVDVLERHYAAMRRYLEYLRRDSTDLVRSAGRYGDWLSLEGPTPKDVVGTAYFAHSARTLGRIAGVLGDERRSARCERLYEAVRARFIEHFVGADGAVAGGTQTGQILALHTGLVPDALRAAAAQRLADSIEAGAGHLATGFLGTPLALPVLSDHGHHELACRVAQQDSFPSWGFQVKQGATTIWERWDGWTPERGFGNEQMNSFNHYSLGSIGDWLYRYVGGLDPDPESPGLARARVRPRPGGTIRSARLAHEAPHGRWEVSWSLEDDELRLDLLVPPNATAEVVLAGAPVREVGSGRHRFVSAG